MYICAKTGQATHNSLGALLVTAPELQFQDVVLPDSSGTAQAQGLDVDRCLSHEEHLGALRAGTRARTSVMMISDVGSDSPLLPGENGGNAGLLPFTHSDPTDAPPTGIRGCHSDHM